MPAPRKRNDSGHRQRNAQKSPRTPVPAQHSPATPELIDPRWLLKALGIVFGVAVLLAWGTLCLLWYQGQWQLVLHPSRTIATSPNPSLFPAAKEIRFFDDATGRPQLSGWLLPDSDSSAAHIGMAPAIDANVPTVLFLRGADGNMSDALPLAYTLHRAHLNVLLFDYRGYGRSVGKHPAQTTMQQDSEAALKFLTGTEHVPANQIILYGEGIGASLAVQLAAEHHDIPAIILDTPDGDLTARVLRDAHSWLIPVHLLFDEDFPLAQQLHNLSTPKLLISYTNAAHPPAAIANAADPKVTLEVPSPADPSLIPAVQRFVDLYLHTSLPAPYTEVHLQHPVPNTYPPS